MSVCDRVNYVQGHSFFKDISRKSKETKNLFARDKYSVRDLFAIKIAPEARRSVKKKT